MKRTITQSSLLALGFTAVLALPLALSGCDTKTTTSSTKTVRETNTPDAKVEQTTKTEIETKVTPK